MSGSGQAPLGETLTVLAIVLAIYFLPVLLAWRRKHPHFAGILALDLLLGWTFLGWAAALVWVFVSPTTGPGRGMKTCPRCAEAVKAAAQVCRHCGYEFQDVPRAPTAPRIEPRL